MNATQKFWDYIMDRIDDIPPSPRWVEVVMHIVSIIVCACLISAMTHIGHAQSRNVPNTSLEVQQAADERDIAANLANIAALKVEINYQRDEIATLRDSVSSIRGFVTGVGSILGFLQAIQVVMTIKGYAPGSKGKHNEHG